MAAAVRLDRRRAACRTAEVRVVGIVAKGANHVFGQAVPAGTLKAAREFSFSRPTGRLPCSIPFQPGVRARRNAQRHRPRTRRSPAMVAMERPAHEGIRLRFRHRHPPHIVSQVATDSRRGGRRAARRPGESSPDEQSRRHWFDARLRIHHGTRRRPRKRRAGAWGTRIVWPRNRLGRSRARLRPKPKTCLPNPNRVELFLRQRIQLRRPGAQAPSD